MTISFNRITTLVMINLLFQANRCQHLPNFPENKTMRVYGGRPVALGEIPYQVGFKTRFISDPKRYYTFCGGAIIGEAKILSAAHCFVGESRNKICPGSTKFKKSFDGKYAVAATVRNFEYFEEEEYEQWRTLWNLTYPENYNFPLHDLAVLFVMKPFEFNHLVKPIRMADRFIDYEGLALVSGYGEISHAVTSDSLLAANLLLFPLKLCSGFHLKIDMSRSICTSLVGTEIGRGDSGGPLVYTHAVDLTGKDDKTLIGIASGTYLGQNSIFVRVSAYRGFIARNCCEEDTSSYFFVVNTLIILQNFIDI